LADLTHVLTLWRSGQSAAAERALDAMLALSPDDPDVLRSLAELKDATGRTDAALGLWRRLAKLRPEAADVRRAFGHALLAAGTVAEAIKVLRGAVALEPANPRGHNNLGLALLRSGRSEDAIASFEAAAAADPAYALGHLNLGIAHELGGRYETARASYDRALALDAHLADARMRLSKLLELTDAAAAKNERERALESLAINLMTVRRHDAALRIFQGLLDDGAALKYLPGMRFDCALNCCDWTGYDSRRKLLEAAVRAGQPVILPFSLLMHADAPEVQLACARAFVADRYPARPAPARPPRAARERVRIAYVSSDFHEHATAYLAAGLFETHDRSRFEVSALSFSPPAAGPLRQRLEGAFDRFIDVGRQSDDEVAALMRTLAVDIAVDLKGFTGGARTGIFARRPAPVQVNYLGYPGTMGAEYIDYIVADRHVIPPADRIHYAEQVIYLPHCYQPNDPQRPRPTEAPARADCGLPGRGFVFCSFNQPYKISPPLFSVWMDLLRKVPDSVLWLLTGNPLSTRNLQTAAQVAGVEPSRIVFAPHIELAQHLARYRHADLFLDSMPCTAHTTASDALWMGVPVLTVTGETFAGRVATSLLHAVGLPELCTTSLGQYATAAVRLAETPAALAELKAHLDTGRERFPLFDIAGYTASLEAAYQQIWDRHVRGHAPAHLSVGAGNCEDSAPPE
jgi:predicted O-linked N-acetylglucosamine transferase (SPINDLY family)